MTVTEQEIWDAFNTALQALPNIDINNVAFLGRGYQPNAETPYIATSMPVIDGKMLTVGQQGVFNWNGVYQVQCNWPIGVGLENMTQQLAAVRVLFPNSLTLTTSGGFFIRCQRARPRPVFEDGSWLRGATQVQWLLQEVV